MYRIEVSNKFKQSLKKLRKGGINLKPINDVINILSKGEILPAKYKNHPLRGKLKGYYDCHVLPDLVLIYKIETERLVLILLDIDTHSNLF